MGSAEQDAFNKSDVNAKDSHDKGTASAADRPSLMSPPQRPVRPVRPAAAPETSVAVKPVVKAADTATVVPKATVTEKAPEPAAPEPDPAAYRYQPIAPPSEPMQYRAIGLVRGTYEPSEADQLNRGNLTTEDGHVIDSVLLGRITSLVKKHIDLTMPHLWVVYPRTRRELDNDDQDLHLQIVGVWEPETLGLPGEAPASENGDEAEEAVSEKPDLADLPPVDDNFFSIRGEVIKYTPEDKCIAVKILQGAKRIPGTSKPFKLLLHGTIEGRTVGYFWDFKVKREAKVLVLSEASPVGIVPPKKRAKGSGGAGPRRGKPGMRSGPGGSRPPMPSRRPTGVKSSDSGTDTRSESVPDRPANRPKKRDDNPESSAE
ncbi:hypothetical protein VB780_10670 [Leptolyngbya sp. CCNP1308]|uniref:hypothetical protein n=1 Tax=Leptolyngbya sp. CCNP1308 TaxID=3110255 RepID=UPI002B21FB03|nr:hypothetical protein [Leptolyngbya sp. CCNP1308]MEA5449033.1 hypothetical protein [Leptolyngbya sp. CCNP1308]